MRYEKGSFITVPSREKLKGLPPSAQAIYMWLCSYANETGNCFPSRKTLAKDSGCSEMTVTRMMDLLIEHGLVEKRHRKKGEMYSSNEYTVLWGGTPTQGVGYSHTERGVLSQSSTNSNQLTQTNEPVEQSSKDFEIVKDEKEEKPKSSRVVTPDMMAVFNIFDDNPARLSWRLRVVERDAAQVLFDEYGLEELKRRYGVIKSYRNEPLCPSINKPSEMLDKMPNMLRFLQNYL